MIEDLEITRDVGPLTRHAWRFYFYTSELTLYVDRFEVQSRPSRRHKFQVDRFYTRIGRDSTIGEADVPIPDDVRAEIVGRIRSMIDLCRWSERPRLRN